MTDQDLLSEIAGGNLGGLGILFDQYEADVRRFIGQLGVRPAEVDDLVQMTFLDVPHAAASFDGRSAVRSWLFGLAAMVVRRHRRTLGRLAANLVAWARQPSRELPNAGERFEIHEEAARAQRALLRLSQKKREVFVMVELEDASGKDAAQALGIPLATVWTRLHHARRELRQYLAEEGS
jgi:RNA polymerase sigma-70 factor (ECF subfamily)